MAAETPLSAQLKDPKAREKWAAEVRESMKKDKKEYDPKKLDSADAQTKNELSRKWIQKLGLWETSVSQVLARLGAESLYDEDLAEKVAKFQTENKLKSKNGIIGWETLESLDSEIQFDKDDNTKKYDFDKAQKDAQSKAEAPNIERAAWYGAPGDSIDAGSYNLDPSYAYEKTEDSIQRTKGGQTEVWDTEGKKWTKEWETNTPTAKPTEQQLADIERAAWYGAPGDSIDAGSYNLDPSYAYEKTEDSIQRTKGGQTEVWDTEGKKWTKEWETNTPTAKPTEQQLADIERAAWYGAPGDSIDAGSYNLDPSYAYEKTEDSIQRTKGGQTEVWDTEGKKWTKEWETNTPTAKPTEQQLAKSETGIKKVKSVIEKWYSQDFQGLQKALTELGITSATISGKKLQTITLWDMLSTVISTGKVGKEWAEMLLNHFLWVHIRNGAMEAGRQIWDSMGTEVRNTAQDDINKQIEISQKFSSIIEKWGDATLGEIFDAWLTQLDGTTRFATAPVRYATAPVRWFIKRISSWFSGK